MFDLLKYALTMLYVDVARLIRGPSSIAMLNVARLKYMADSRVKQYCNAECGKVQCMAESDQCQGMA